MQELDDNALLREFASRNSEDAFAALVARHINKIYSVALRHTRNPHQAEEITQAVFVILAQKANTLSRHPRLSGWLFEAARLTAMTFLRGEIRRKHREQEASMQTLTDEPDAHLWSQIAPQLDAAIASLNEVDRHAVVLRFFDGKSMKEVGTALGASEDAAKVRVNRAVDKLQKFFVKRGVTTTAETIAGAISVHSMQVAPIGLAKAISVLAVAKGATASISISTLAKATLIAMKTKTIVATAATAVVVVSITAWLGIYFSRPHKAAPDLASVRFPIQLANEDSRRSAQDPLFDIGFDPDMRRTSNSAPAIHIKGPLPPPPDLPANYSDAALQKAGEASSIPFMITNGSPLLGQHVRITGWLKCSNVQNWAAAYFCIYNPNNNQFFRFDSMDDRDNRPILQGTMDWQQIEFVTDIPDEACILFVGPDLYGPGELWGDDFQINLASADTPITDDRQWRHTSATPNTYSKTIDYQTKHNGHATVCLTYTGASPAPTSEWAWWGQKLRGADAEKYAGHTIEWSGWIKTENVSSRFHPVVRPYTFNPLNGKASNDSKDKMGPNSNLKGTRDWTKFTDTCTIPDDINHLDTAFIFYGSGKAWIDMDSLKIRIIK